MSVAKTFLQHRSRNFGALNALKLALNNANSAFPTALKFYEKIM